MKRFRHLKLTPIGQYGKCRPFTIGLWSIFLLAGMMWPSAGCKQADDIEKSMLLGKWDIIKAERNGRETPYLRNGYLIINADASMIVNITGADEKGKYVLDDETVIMNETEEFVIKSITADSMTMHYRANAQSEFMFYMLRHENQVQ